MESSQSTIVDNYVHKLLASSHETQWTGSLPSLSDTLINQRKIVHLPTNTVGSNPIEKSLWEMLIGAAERSPLSQKDTSNINSSSTSNAGSIGNTTNSNNNNNNILVPSWIYSLLTSLQIPQKYLNSLLLTNPNSNTHSNSNGNGNYSNSNNKKTTESSNESSDQLDRSNNSFALFSSSSVLSSPNSSISYSKPIGLEDWIRWNGLVDITEENVSLEEVAASLFGEDEEGALAFATKMEEMLKILHQEQTELRLQQAEIYASQFESGNSSYHNTNNSNNHSNSSSRKGSSSISNSTSETEFSFGEETRKRSLNTLEPTFPSLAYISTPPAIPNQSKLTSFVGIAENEITEEEAQVLTEKLLEMQKAFQEEQKELKQQELDFYIAQFEINREKQQKLIDEAKSRRPRGLSVKSLLSSITSSPSKQSPT